MFFNVSVFRDDAVVRKKRDDSRGFGCCELFLDPDEGCARGVPKKRLPPSLHMVCRRFLIEVFMELPVVCA